MADNYDVIVAGVFVRVSSASGRLDLAPPVVKLLQDVARASERRSQPFVAMFFGNPYTPMFAPEIPAMLLTYDFSDYAEESAVKAIAGEIAIGGKLPIALPGLFPVGHGLARPARSPFDSTTSLRDVISLRAGAFGFSVDVFLPPGSADVACHECGVRRRHIIALTGILATSNSIGGLFRNSGGAPFDDPGSCLVAPLADSDRGGSPARTTFVT
jgi:hypothetical protein